jgi:hypothetical protein
MTSFRADAGRAAGTTIASSPLRAAGAALAAETSRNNDA